MNLRADNVNETSGDLSLAPQTRVRSVSENLFKSMNYVVKLYSDSEITVVLKNKEYQYLAKGAGSVVFTDKEGEVVIKIRLPWVSINTEVSDKIDNNAFLKMVKTFFNDFHSVWIVGKTKALLKNCLFQ